MMYCKMNRVDAEARFRYQAVDEVQVSVEYLLNAEQFNDDLILSFPDDVVLPDDILEICVSDKQELIRN